MPYFTDRWEPSLCGAEDCPRGFPARVRRRRAVDLASWRALWRTRRRAEAWDDADAEERHEDAEESMTTGTKVP